MKDDVIKLDLSNPPTTTDETVKDNPIDAGGVVDEPKAADAPQEQAEVPKEVETQRTPTLNEDGDIVINLNKEDDAVQQIQGESEEGLPRDEGVDKTESPEEERSPLTIVNEEEVKEVTGNPLEQVVTEQRELPEDIDKLISFMEDTGGTVEDFVNLGRNLEDYDDNLLIKEYLKESKPYLDEEDITSMMDKKYSESTDEYAEESDIRANKLARKEVLFEAKNHFKNVQDKYYADLKLSKQLSGDPEIVEAVEFYQNYQKGVESSNKFNEDFQAKNSTLFNQDFKGFDFNVGDNKYRYNADAGKTKEVQSDVNNIFSKFYDDKSGLLNDPKGYHKALFAANNADKLANHFYEQGRAEAIKQGARDAKNINMGARSDNDSVTTPSGTKVKIVSGIDKHSFGTKLRVKGWTKP